MTTFSTYIHQSVGDAALHGAIQGLFVTLLFSTAAGFLWICRKWRQWFANNLLIRVILPVTALGGLLIWGVITTYLYAGGLTGVGGLGLLLAMPFIIYRRWTAHTRFKP
jgi:hypothetical protein